MEFRTVGYLGSRVYKDEEEIVSAAMGVALPAGGVAKDFVEISNPMIKLHGGMTVVRIEAPGNFVAEFNAMNTYNPLEPNPDPDVLVMAIDLYQRETEDDVFQVAVGTSENLLDAETLFVLESWAKACNPNFRADYIINDRFAWMLTSSKIISKPLRAVLDGSIMRNGVMHQITPPRGPIEVGTPTDVDIAVAAAQVIWLSIQ